MKLTAVFSLIVFGVFSLSTSVIHNLSYYLSDQSVKVQQHVDLDKYHRPDSVAIKISIGYLNREALIDLGNLLGNLKSPVSGTSCFGSCHNVAKGGHPDDILPSGGGEERTIVNRLYKKWVNDKIEMPFDRPTKDSPGFVDNCLDTTILWDAIPSEFPFEEQGRRGIDAHDEDALALMAENNFLARTLHIHAYGHDTITNESVICAISAYEQTIVSNHSNISRGIVTKNKGLYLFDKHCNSCHSANIPSPTGVALSGEGIGTRAVKIPKLTGFFLAPNALFSTAEEVPVYRDIIWAATKMHNEVLGMKVTYGESRSIASFMKTDYTDYDLERYE